MEESQVEQKPQSLWQRWKRILLVIILFSILAGSLIYYVLPRVLTPPLRKDSIPSDAYIIPWMQPDPSIEALWLMKEWDIDVVLANALKLNITFNITIPNGTRIVPSTVYLCHDTEYLYVGGKFVGMGKNPASGLTTLANYFNIYFDVANDGVLTSPESGSRFPVWINSPESDLRNKTDDWRTGLIWSYDDLIWTRSREFPHNVWLDGEDYYHPSAQPAFGLGNEDMGYDKWTGTVIILFSRYLRRAATSEINAFQMRRGERWAMGFLFELGYNNWSGVYQDFVDGWLKKIYPYTSNDSSWWPKLVIDLSNPPASFST